MSQINPLTGALVHAPTVQQTAAEKDRQLRRVQNLAKNTALQGDRLEHQVESTEALHAIDDGRDSYQPRGQSGQHQQSASDEPKPDDAGHIDLNA